MKSVNHTLARRELAVKQVPMDGICGGY